MTRIKHILILFVVALHMQVFAQVNYSLTGVVTDSATGEPIIGAIIRVTEIKTVGAATDFDGRFQLLLPEGQYTINSNVTGYRQNVRRIQLSGDTAISFAMKDTSYQFETVIITAERPDENISDPQMGAQQLSMKDANKLPVLFGERDILKTAQLLPGIKSSGDGGSGIFVRGGAADQNLVLLDDAPVFSSSHLLGFFSTFDSDLLSNVTVYKGNQPAYYGGRLASALDVKMREGSKDRFSAGGGLGLISSKIHAEGPIVPGQSSFLFGARRTYADIFLGLSRDSAINNNRLYFYDLNGKIALSAGPRNDIYLSGYYGRDYFGVDKLFGINWGNATGSLRWNHTWNDKLYSSAFVILSDYDYKIDVTSGMEDYQIHSRIRSHSLKYELHYFPNDDHAVRIGISSAYHTVTPGQLEVEEGSLYNPAKLQQRRGLESAVYFSDEWKINSRWSIIYGARVAAFNVLGAGDFYRFDESGKITDTLHYNAMQVAKTYLNIEPRFSVAHVINNHASVKVSYARNTQNLHQVSNSVASGPTDVWLMNSLNVKPEIADQFSAGVYRNFLGNAIEFSAEVYYKRMQNQIDYRNGADTESNELIEGELVYGDGRAYGLEVFLRKKTGKFTGWISYTLSRSERQFEAINSGNWYPVRQDRTHDISIVLMYELSKRWSLAATWVFSTGNAVTFPGGKYFVDGQVQFMYTERNGYRMPAYHRLDLGATCQLKKTEKFESSLNISVFNAYARENAYAITFRESQTDPGQTEAVRIALFRIIPSVTYNFKF